MNLSTYLPQDRRRALAQNDILPDHATGSIIFADISGFTSLTERLRHSLGPRRGAEALSDYLSAAYTALIAAVEQYGGSVISFSGDAITCWFDDADGAAPPRAVACAVSLQTAMQDFTEISLPNDQTGQLTIKIGVATGQVRRLVVGDEAHFRLDVLAGETVNRMAVAEQLATSSEIILDELTSHALGQTNLAIAEWRVSPTTGERFGLLKTFTAVVTPTPLPPLPDLDEETARLWLTPLVYARAKAGDPLLLTDFRPCAALFVRFMGIDYAADTAVTQLNQFISQLQAILAYYNGTLIDLTFGDKGSYACINFGALSVHEDDTRRAVKTAIQLRQAAQNLPFLEPLQIGIATGVMLTGAHGGTTRRHYSALGDAANLAARLMAAAAPGEILVSQQLYQAVQQEFFCVPQTPLRFKGKADPITPYRFIAIRPARPLPIPEPAYTLRLVGRQAELATIAQKLDLTATGQSQIVCLVGEAGLGKSRLAVEAIRLAQGRDFMSYGGVCQADGLNTPYLVWKQILVSFFGLNVYQPHAQQIHHLHEQIRRYAPEREESLPLLGRLLGLPIPENKWTRQLEPKDRQIARHALLEDCLKQASQSAPLLLMVEDLHWIDAISHDLLVELAYSCAAYPIFFLLVYRPTPLPRLQAPRLEARPNFTPLPLAALNETEAQQMIQAKLAQLYPTHDSDVSPALVQMLLTRAEGNPFYLEELLNFFYSRGFDPRDETSWEIDLPDSLHALILSRLDQLPPRQKRTMRVASVIGRLFPVSWLTGYFPALGKLPQVQADLTTLNDLDLILPDSSEPELTYLFKHAITHEVTYDSFPFATRIRLHEQLARYLEEINAPLDSVAHHYGQSNNKQKQIEYFRKAGEAAQRNYGNEVALDYFGRLLPLLADDPVAQQQVQIERGYIFSLIASYDKAEAAYQEALTLAQALGDMHALAQCYYHLGHVRALQSRPQATDWFDQAERLFTTLDDTIWLARIYGKRANLAVQQGRYAEGQALISHALNIAEQSGDANFKGRLLILQGTLFFFLGDYEAAMAVEEEALTILQALDNKIALAALLSNMGQIYSVQGFYEKARYFYKQCLALAQLVGDKERLVNIWANLGLLAYEEGKLAEAQALQKRALVLAREIGHQYAECITLLNLGNLAVAQQDAAAARVAYLDGLRLSQAIQDQNNLFYSLNGLAATAVLEQNLPRAARLAAAAETLRQRLGTAWDNIEGRIYENTRTAAQTGLVTAEFETAWAEGEQMSLAEVVAYAFTM